MLEFTENLQHEIKQLKQDEYTKKYWKEIQTELKDVEKNCKLLNENK